MNMTDPDLEYPFLRWPVRSLLSASWSDLSKQNADNCQGFHLPVKSTPLIYFQQNEQPVSTSTSSRKRKQPLYNDSPLFLAPSIPAKRPNCPSMYLSTMPPSNGSVVMFLNRDQPIQTEPNPSFLSLKTSCQYDIEQENLMVQIRELRRARTDLQQQYQSTSEKIEHCLSITRTLLIEKSQFEKKQTREKVMHNRLRLGQFLTQRQGASFVEQWIDGSDFSDQQRAQKRLMQTKENLDRERKSLAKKKLFLQLQEQFCTDTNNNQCNSQELTDFRSFSPTKSKRMKKTSMLSPQKCATMIGTGYLSSDHSNDGHLLYSVDSNHLLSDSGSSSSSSSSSLFSNNSSLVLQLKDWYEYDEVLRLRQLTLKREENELAQDLEKLDRERNVHIKELKRLYNEDQSRFKGNHTLNNRYLLLTLIGKGGFSEVHQAYDFQEQRHVACKIHQLTKEWKEEKKANFIKHALREYEIHKHLDHKRIVKLFDVFEIDKDSFCTVLEYCDGNDLDFYLKQNKTVPEKEARSIVVQIMSALKYLNSDIQPAVIHYDLKPANILLGTGDNSRQLKITDFGLSKQMHEDKFDEDGMDLSSQGAGTYWYLPPEVFVQSTKPPKISSKVDVWSVGCIFYQCLYGRKAYGHNLSQAAVLENQIILNAKEIQFPQRPTVSNETKAFIRRCLTYQVPDRPDVLQLCDDDYLKSHNKRTSSTSPSFIPRSK